MTDAVTYLFEAWQDPAVRFFLLCALGGVAFSVITLSVKTSVDRMYNDEIEEMLEAEEPLHTYRFSKQCELRVFDDGVQIFRGGAAVSPLFTEVWDVRARHGDGGCVLEVRHMGEDGPETSQVRVGELSETGAARVREAMLHYAGG